MTNLTLTGGNSHLSIGRTLALVKLVLLVASAVTTLFAVVGAGALLFISLQMGWQVLTILWATSIYLLTYIIWQFDRPFSLPPSDLNPFGDQ